MPTKSYTNPVWPGDFADPYVIRVGREYYAYGTAPIGQDGKPFPILRSHDLVQWEPVGGALVPLNPPAKSYWAPEVAQANGKFYLYYSASMIDSDSGHRIRVAISDIPGGPFVDIGKPLFDELGFNIDASPFIDPRDQKPYLFFAMDFEKEDPIGTGICVIELDGSMTRAIGAPKTVVRASAPWQIYERNRDYKGRVWPVWNCVEGPSAIAHDGKYYCLYSGGAWSKDNYGVGCVVADRPLGPWRPVTQSDEPTVLKGIPNHVIGPGHNSVVRGPDGKTLFIIYHAWDSRHDSRRMHIDPLKWTDKGPQTVGPSYEPRTIQIAEESE
jgi:beta-xylosidase